MLSFVIDIMVVPSELPIGSKAHFNGLVRVLKQKKISLALIITALGYGATFTVYTYITPILQKQMHWSANMIVVILIVYGIMVAVGNNIGGKLANQAVLRQLIKIFSGLLLVMFILLFTIYSHWLGLISILGLGLFAFMNVPGLQLYIVQMAERYVPNDIALASALNISAFNVGISFGSLVSGQVVNHLGLAWTPLLGVLMALSSIGLTVYLQKAD